MIIFFIILVLVFLKDIKVNIKDFNKEYMSRNNTTIINGIFVIIVLFSHFMTYTSSVNNLDTSLQTITKFLGQLMVTTFLFYSGYGIYEQIKKDRKKYMDGFLKKIFILYFATWFSFKLFKTSNKYNLLLLTIISIIYIYVLHHLKDNYWCDTILCFSAGMWYSYFKDKIDRFIMKNNISFFITFIISIGLFILLYDFGGTAYIHNILAVIFVVIINLISMKIHSTSKALLLVGKNVFWIYILQRLPMIFFKDKLNIYVYFVVCCVITAMLTYLMQKLTKLIWKKN